MTRIFGQMSDGRLAVSILFFINGTLIGAWTPMIPSFKQRLMLSESEMGLVILALGLGAITAMPFIGAFIARNGVKIPLIYLTVICSFGLTLLALIPSFTMAIIVMVIFGATWSGMDISMNANAIDVEKYDKSPMMSSCHGFWSVGGLFGALLGGATLSTFGELGHGIFWQSTFIILALVASRFIYIANVKGADGTKPKLEFPRSILPYMLGAVAFFSVVPEGVIVDWSGLFLYEERGVSLTMAGYGFAATSASMALMRFFGDPLRQRYGAVPTLRVSVVIAIIGFAIVTLSSSPYISIFGFFIAGLGLANLFPITISAAGNLPNIPSGIAASLVASVGYSGILLAPPLFGIVAQKWDYATIFMIVPFCLIIVLFLLYPARYADVQKDDG